MPSEQWERFTHGPQKGKINAVFVILAAGVVCLGTAVDECHPASDNVAGRPCSNARYVFVLTISTITIVLALLRLFLVYAMSSTPFIVDIVMSMFLTALWAAGAGVNTEVGGIWPLMSNGYLGTWVALIAAVYYLLHSANHLRIVAARTLKRFNPALTLLFFASLVEMCVAANLCSQAGVPCERKVAFAVAVGTISTFVCICILIFEIAVTDSTILPTAHKVSAIFLLVLWAVGTGVNTCQSGPFPNSITANGFFATWLAFFAAVMFTSSIWLHHDFLKNESNSGNVAMSTGGGGGGSEAGASTQPGGQTSAKQPSASTAPTSAAICATPASPTPVKSPTPAHAV